MSTRSRRKAQPAPTETRSADLSNAPMGPVEEISASEEENSWLDGVESYFGIQWAPLDNGSPNDATDSTPVVAENEQSGELRPMTHVKMDRISWVSDGLIRQWTSIDYALTETRTSWSHTTKAVTDDHQKQVSTLGVALDQQDTVVQDLTAALQQTGPESKDATLLAQQLVAAEQERKQTEARRSKLHLDLLSMESMTDLQTKATELQIRRTGLRNQLLTATEDERPTLLATERRLVEDEGVLKAALNAARPDFEPGVDADALTRRAVERRAALATREGETPEATAQRRANVLAPGQAPAQAPNGDHILAADSTTQTTQWDVLGDDPGRTSERKRTVVDDGITTTTTRTNQASLKDVSVEKKRSQTIAAKDAGSTTRTTGGKVGLKDGASFGVSDEQSAVLPDNATTSKKSTGSMTFTGEGATFDAKRTNTAKGAGDLDPTQTSSTGLTGTWNDKNKEIGFNHDHSKLNPDQTGDSSSFGGALVNGEQGTGVKANLGNTETVADPKNGRTTTTASKTNGTLTDRTAAYGRDTTTTKSGAGKPKTETKVGHNGSYTADIFQDPASGLYKLKVTLTVGGSIGKSAETGDAAATTEDTKSHQRRAKGKVGGSVEGGITITKTRLLTESEKAAYLTELDKAGTTGKTGSSKPEIKALARATAGIGEVSRLANAVNHPSIASSLAEGEELEMEFKGGGSLSGGAGGTEVGAKGSVTRTVKLSRGKARTETSPDGTKRTVKPVAVTLSFGSSNTLHGKASMEGGAAKATGSIERTASSGSGKTFELDAASDTYASHMSRILAADTPGALATLATHTDLKQTKWTESNATQVKGSMEGEFLKGVGSVGVSEQNHLSTDLSVDLVNKSLKDSKVSGGSGGSMKFGALGIEASGGSESKTTAVMGENGIEGSFENKETSGFSAIGGLIASRTDVLTAIDFDEADLAGLVGRASQKTKWNGFTYNHYLLKDWQHLGRRLRRPKTDPRLMKVNAKEARSLARAQALAAFAQSSDTAGHRLVERCLHDWDGGSDLGVKTQFAKEETAWFGDKDTTEGLTRKEWRALKAAYSAVKSLKSNEEGAATRKAFEDAATAAEDKLSTGEMDPRARAEMRDQIMRWRNNADQHGMKPSTVDLSMGPTVEAAEALREKDVARLALAEKKLERLDALIAGLQKDEVHELRTIVDELDDNAWIYDEKDLSGAMHPLRKLHDEWDTQMTALESALVAVGRTPEQIARRLKVRRPRKDWVTKIDAVMFEGQDERRAVATPLRTWLDSQP